MVTPTITHAPEINIVSARDHFLFLFVKHLGKFSSNMPLQSLLLPTNDENSFSWNLALKIIEG